MAANSGSISRHSYRASAASALRPRNRACPGRARDRCRRDALAPGDRGRGQDRLPRSATADELGIRLAPAGQVPTGRAGAGARRAPWRAVAAAARSPRRRASLVVAPPTRRDGPRRPRRRRPPQLRRATAAHCRWRGAPSAPDGAGGCAAAWERSCGERSSGYGSSGASASPWSSSTRPLAVDSGTEAAAAGAGERPRAANRAPAPGELEHRGVRAILTRNGWTISSRSPAAPSGQQGWRGLVHFDSPPTPVQRRPLPESRPII